MDGECASESDSQLERAGSGREGRKCEALAGSFGGQQRFGMIFAATALDPAAEETIGLLDVLRPAASGLADLVGANHIAAANDHGGSLCYCE